MAGRARTPAAAEVVAVVPERLPQNLHDAEERECLAAPVVSGSRNLRTNRQEEQSFANRGGWRANVREAIRS